MVFHVLLNQMPEMLDWFGWCTWDAFYTEVNPQGIENGLKRCAFIPFKYLFQVSPCYIVIFSSFFPNRPSNVYCLIFLKNYFPDRVVYLLKELSFRVCMPVPFHHFCYPYLFKHCFHIGLFVLF